VVPSSQEDASLAEDKTASPAEAALSGPREPVEVAPGTAPLELSADTFSFETQHKLTAVINPYNFS